MMNSNPKRFVLLDRDGTIIVNKHYQKNPADTELLPNAKAGLDRLRAAGFGLVVVSNQSGIGRGILTEGDIAAVNASMVAALEGGADYFAGLYHCPHVAADGCRCRKPEPGLIEMAANELGFDATDCYVVGDRCLDVAAGKAAGATAVLVLTGNGAEEEAAARGTGADFVAADLLAAAEWIIARDSAINPSVAPKP